MDIFMALTFLTKGLKEHITTPQTDRETVADFYVVYPFLNICQFLIVYIPRSLCVITLFGTRYTFI